ncbi:Uncharacterised protein [Vibrio cholerae]|nr:Uncharacterised protein [Vibrio cholerae]
MAFAKPRIFLRRIDEVISYSLSACGVKSAFCSTKLSCGTRLGWADNGCSLLGSSSKEVELPAAPIRLSSACNGSVLVGNSCFSGSMSSVKSASRSSSLEANSASKDPYCSSTSMALPNSTRKR